MESPKIFISHLLEIRFIYILFLTSFLYSCKNSNKKVAIVQKNEDSIFIDSLMVVGTFYGRMSAFKAVSKSYIFNDSVSNILRGKLTSKTDSSEFSRVKATTNDKTNPQISYKVLTSGYGYDKIMVEFYLPSPDLEISRVRFKKPDILIINLSGSILSKNVKNRHVQQLVCRVLCKIQIPNDIKNYKIYFEPLPYDEDYIYQPLKEPWISNEGWRNSLEYK